MSTSLNFKHTVIDADGPENPHIKEVGDIAGNNLADVVVASSNGGPLVWYEAPRWTKHVIAPSGKWSCLAVLADMDGDGDRDLLISEWYGENRMEWYENPLPDGDPAAGPWKRHIIGSPRAHDIEVVDLDGDGQLEFVTRTQGDDGDKIVVWKRDGATWRQGTIRCPVGEGLAVADIDRDGRPEIIIGDRWYSCSGDILGDTWQERVFGDWPADAIVRVADMNNNGRLDVVLARSEGVHGLAWFEAPEDPESGSWTEHGIDDTIEFVHSLRVCDLDNDGNLDVVAAEMHQSPGKRVMIYLNQGDSIGWQPQVLATTGSHAVCVGDTTGNGRIDIIGANWRGRYQPIELWENQGQG